MSAVVLAGGSRFSVGLVMIDCPPDPNPTRGDLERRRGSENRGGDLGTVSSGVGDGAGVLNEVVFDAGVGVFVGVGVGAGAGKSRLENDDETEETLVIGVGVGVGGMEWSDVAMML